MASGFTNGDVFSSLLDTDIAAEVDVEHKRTTSFAKGLEKATAKMIMIDFLLTKAQVYVERVEVGPRGKTAKIFFSSHLEHGDRRLAPELIKHLESRFHSERTNIIRQYRGLIGTGPTPALEVEYVSRSPVEEHESLLALNKLQSEKHEREARQRKKQMLRRQRKQALARDPRQGFPFSL